MLFLIVVLSFSFSHTHTQQYTLIDRCQDLKTFILGNKEGSFCVINCAYHQDQTLSSGILLYISGYKCINKCKLYKIQYSKHKAIDTDAIQHLMFHYLAHVCYGQHIHLISDSVRRFSYITLLVTFSGKLKSIFTCFF